MKKESTSDLIKRLSGLYVSLIILLVFTAMFLYRGNYEFLTYTVTIGILIWILTTTDKIYHYPQISKWGFSLWLFLHFLGGVAKINGIRLYDSILIPIISDPINLLRYDQVMHALCYFVIVFFVYSIVKDHLKENSKKWTIALIIILMAEGVGALNEIIELFTVIVFRASGVGDYFNNAIDLITNLIGASIGALIILRNK